MNQQTNNVSSTKKTMYSVAYILSILFAVITAILIIPLCWTIPMTMMIKNAKLSCGTSQEKSHLILTICSFFFLGIITGIFLLVAEISPSNNNNVQNTNVQNNNNPEN